MFPELSIRVSHPNWPKGLFLEITGEDWRKESVLQERVREVSTHFQEEALVTIEEIERESKVQSLLRRVVKKFGPNVDADDLNAIEDWLDSASPLTFPDISTWTPMAPINVGNVQADGIFGG